MLVLHPNSTCDVCLDNYSSGTHSPHAIACGHVFCHGCLESLSKPICPLCRTRFEPQDIRKLHIDRAQTPRAPLLTHTEAPKPNSEANQVFSQEARSYQTDITRIVREGAPASELRMLIDQCHIWLKSQPHDQHQDLRVSFLLLYNLTETQRKLAVETESVRGLRTECEDLKSQMDSERAAARRKYAELEQTSADEKDTALAIEKSLRDHYQQLDSEWRRHYELVLTECRRLEKEIEQAKYPYNPLPERRSADTPRNRNSDHRMDIVEHDDHTDTPSAAMARKLKEDMFHLSPLPANIPPLPSAIQRFSALADEDDDFVSKPPARDQKAITYDVPSQSSVEPIPIPSNSHTSRLQGGIQNGLPMSVPKTLDLWGSGAPRSLPRAQDVTMGSVSSSPSADSVMRDRPSPPQAAPLETRARGMSIGRGYHYSEERREREPAQETSRSRQPVEQQDRRRVQLHNLLDSPISSSLPGGSHLHAPLVDSPPRSYSIPPRDPSPPIKAPTPPAVPNVRVNTISHASASASIPPRPPLMSHASSAAIRLEQERHEKERNSQREREQRDKRDQREPREQQRERERERDSHRHISSSNTNSLRDTTNAYYDKRTNTISHTGKSKTQAYA